MSLLGRLGFTHTDGAVRGFIGGRKKSTSLRGALRLSHYLDIKKILDAAPPSCDNIGGTAFSWWGNNKIGNCTVASLYHRRQLIAAQTGEAFSPPAIGAEGEYAAITGYDGTPGDASDRGAEPTQVLAHGTTAGIAGEKINRFAAIDTRNPDEVRAAIWLFDVAYVGGELPKALDDQGFNWTIPAIGQRGVNDQPAPDRGHQFLFGGYERDVINVVTWASGQYTCTDEWNIACVDEGYVLLTDALATAARKSPNGFDIDRLIYDMAAL